MVYVTNSCFEAKHTILYIHYSRRVSLGYLFAFQFLGIKLLTTSLPCACIYLLKAHFKSFGYTEWHFWVIGSLGL